MAIKLGSVDINSINLGGVGLNRIYSGSDFVFGSLILDSSTVSIINQMIINGSEPTTDRKIKINQLVLDLKGIGTTGTADIWSTLDVLQIYYADNIIQAKTEWIRANGTLDPTEVNNPSFAVLGGFTFAVGKNLNTNYQPTNDGINYGLNNALVGAWGGRTTGSPANPYLTGIQETPGSVWIRLDNDGTIDKALNAASFTAGSFSKTTDGLYCLSRPNSTQVKIITDGIINSTQLSTAAAVPSIYTFYIAGLNRASPSSFVSNAKAFFAGSDINGNQVQLYNSLNKYINP